MATQPVTQPRYWQGGTFLCPKHGERGPVLDFKEPGVLYCRDCETTYKQRPGGMGFEAESRRKS